MHHSKTPPKFRFQRLYRSKKPSNSELKKKKQQHHTFWSRGKWIQVPILFVYFSFLRNGPSQKIKSLTSPIFLSKTNNPMASTYGIFKYLHLPPKKTPNVGKYTSPMHGMRITWRFISHPPPSVWNTSRISKTSSKVAEQTQDVASVKPRWTILSAIQDIGSWQFCEHDLFGHG